MTDRTLIELERENADLRERLHRQWVLRRFK